MKKTFILFILVIFTSVFSFTSDFAIGLNINYGHGISDFFSLREANYQFQGQTFIENRQNKVGLGFNLSLYIPVVKNLYIAPGYSIHNNHQHYEYTEYVGEQENGSQKDDYFFQIHSPAINILYDFLRLKNGWIFSISAGVNYNFLRKDGELNFDLENYMGFSAGLYGKFFALKNLGFQIIFFYNTSFSDPTLSYINGSVGLIYRFQ